MGIEPAVFFDSLKVNPKSSDSVYMNQAMESSFGLLHRLLAITEMRYYSIVTLYFLVTSIVLYNVLSLFNAN